jgi:hypothetical protein
MYPHPIVSDAFIGETEYSKLSKVLMQARRRRTSQSTASRAKS